MIKNIQRKQIFSVPFDEVIRIAKQCQSISIQIHAQFDQLLIQWNQTHNTKQSYQKLRDLLKIGEDSDVVEYLRQRNGQKKQKTFEERFGEFLIKLKQNNRDIFDKTAQKMNEMKSQNIYDDKYVAKETIKIFEDKPQLHSIIKEMLVQYQPDFNIKDPVPVLQQKTFNQIFPHLTQQQENQFLNRKLFKKESAQRQFVSKLLNLYLCGIINKDEILNMLSQNMFTSKSLYHTLVMAIKKSEFLWVQMKEIQYDLYQREIMKRLLSPQHTSGSQLIKIINLYSQGIINKKQICQMLIQNIPNKEELDIIVRSINIREQSRNSNQVFQPVRYFKWPDNYKIGTSYRKRPHFFVTYNKNKQDNIFSEIINTDLIIQQCQQHDQKQPEYSEEIESQDYSQYKLLMQESQSQKYQAQQRCQVNKFQTNLLNSEDQRYQLDLIIHRYKIVLKLLKKIVNVVQYTQQQEETLKLIMDLNVIQTIYKLATFNEKLDMQANLKSVFKKQLIQMFILSVQKEIEKLMILRNDQPTRLWEKVASENFQKYLIASNYQKNCDKFMENQQEFLENKYFYKKKKINSIFDSFKTLAPIHSVRHNKFPKLEFVETEKNNPFEIFYFQNQYIKSLVLSLILNHIDKKLSGTKNLDIKLFFENFIATFLKIEKLPSISTLNQQQYQKIIVSVHNFLPIRIRTIESEIVFPPVNNNSTKQKKKRQCFSKDKQIIQKQLSFNPSYNRTSDQLFYGKIEFFNLFRQFYILYQRCLRAYQICFTFDTDLQLAKQQKQKIGKSRFSLVINDFLAGKSQKISKERLKNIFGQHYYIFSNIEYQFRQLLKKTEFCIKQPIFQKIWSQYKYKFQANYLNTVFHKCQSFKNCCRIIFKQNMLYFNRIRSTQWKPILNQLQTASNQNNKKSPEKKILRKRKLINQKTKDKIIEKQQKNTKS